LEGKIEFTAKCRLSAIAFFWFRRTDSGASSSNREHAGHGPSQPRFIRLDHKYFRMMKTTAKPALYATTTIIATTAVWVSVYLFFLRPLVVRIYRGESLPVLNRLIQFQAVHPLDYYLDKLWMMTWLTLPPVILLVCVALAWDKRWEIAMVLILLFTAVEVRLPGLFGRAMWEDEAITLLQTAGNPDPQWSNVAAPARVAKQLFQGDSPLSEITQDLRQNDVHPPIYYWGVALWRRMFGYSLEAARAFSLVCSVGAVLAFYFLLRAGRVGSPFAAAMVYALSTSSVSLAATARNYALTSLWVVLAGLFAVLAQNLFASRRRQAFICAMASAVFSGLAFQTHYFALFPVAVIQLWLFFRLWRRSKSLAVCIPLVAAAIGTVGLSTLLRQLGARPDAAVGFPGFADQSSLILQSTRAVLWATWYSLPRLLNRLPGIGILVLFAITTITVIRNRFVTNRPVWILFLAWAVALPLGLLVLDFISNKDVASSYYLEFANPALAAMIMFPIAKALSSKEKRALGIALLAVITGFQMLGINWGNETPDAQARSLARTIKQSDSGSQIVVMAGARLVAGPLVYEMDPESLIFPFDEDTEVVKAWSTINTYQDVWIVLYSVPIYPSFDQVGNSLLSRIRTSGFYEELATQPTSFRVFHFRKTS
jgi:hypothetical protein